jgi:hypothetical protein
MFVRGEPKRKSKKWRLYQVVKTEGSRNERNKETKKTNTNTKSFQMRGAGGSAVGITWHQPAKHAALILMLMLLLVVQCDASEVAIFEKTKPLSLRVTFYNAMQYGVKVKWRNPESKMFQEVGHIHGMCSAGFEEPCRESRNTFVGHEFAFVYNMPCRIDGGWTVCGDRHLYVIEKDSNVVLISEEGAENVAEAQGVPEDKTSNDLPALPAPGDIFREEGWKVTRDEL